MRSIGLDTMSGKVPLLEEGPEVSPRSPEQYEIKKVLEENEFSSAWLLSEFQVQFSLAGPMVCVNVMQYAVNLVSVMFVGHLGELALASASVATSFTGVTGFSLLLGMGSALETLCGQAYGAKQYHLLGVYLQRAILVLTAACLPVSILWLGVSPFLRAIGQDPEISHYAGEYARWMLPSLFAFAALQPLVKFLQTQSAVLPMALSSALTLGAHIPTCWLIIYKFGVGYRGAAVANSISQWLNVAFLVLYIKFSPTCRKTWAGFSTEAFHEIKAFFELAIPSATMICLEYWSVELMVILSGLLPNPQLEMSAFSISLNILVLSFMIPLGLGASVSTRVSNELGAGKPAAAKNAVGVGVSWSLILGLFMSIVTVSAKHFLGYAFSNEAEVVDYVASTIPYLSVMITLNSLQAVLCGVLRGCGNQSLGAYTNLGAFYAVGIPLAVTLAFHYHLNVRGLWIGIIAAIGVQTISLLTIACYTNWEKQAHNARNRVYGDRLLTEEIVL